MLRSLSTAFLALLAAACGSSAAWKPPPGPTTIPVAPVWQPPPAAPASAAAPRKPPATPVDAALPSPENAPALERAARCKTGLCRLAALAPEEARKPEAMGDKARALAWEHTIDKGATLAFPRDAQVDVVGIVLGGRVGVVPDGEKADPKPVGAWHAFLAPGAGVQLEARDGAARVALAVVSADRAIDEAIRGLGAQAAKKPAEPLAWTKRPAPVAHVDLAAQPDLAWGGGAWHARIGFEAPASTRASLTVLRFSKDAGVPEHVHDKEWEHLVVLEGEGQLVWKPDGKEEKVVSVKAGSLVAMPPATPHAWKPAGTAPLTAIQVYTPPGPEQRFRARAAEAAKK